jgi:hypothetical protein
MQQARNPAEKASLPVAVPVPASGDAPTRTCARCRQDFPGDPSLFLPPGTVTWWACEPCRALLFATPA